MEDFGKQERQGMEKAELGESELFLMVIGKRESRAGNLRNRKKSYR